MQAAPTGLQHVSVGGRPCGPTVGLACTAQTAGAWSKGYTADSRQHSGWGSGLLPLDAPALSGSYVDTPRCVTEPSRRTQGAAAAGSHAAPAPAAAAGPPAATPTAALAGALCHQFSTQNPADILALPTDGGYYVVRRRTSSTGGGSQQAASLRPAPYRSATGQPARQGCSVRSPAPPAWTPEQEQRYQLQLAHFRQLVSLRMLLQQRVAHERAATAELAARVLVLRAAASQQIAGVCQQAVQGARQLHAQLQLSQQQQSGWAGADVSSISRQEQP